MAEKRVIGVLEAVNKHNGHFNDNDLRLLQAISGPLAVAIDNARLHTDVVSEKRRVETIFASMSEGLLTATKDGWITAANDAFLTLLKSPDTEVVGKRLEEVIQTQPATFANFTNKVLRADQSFPHLACDLHQGNGEYVPVLVSGTTIPQGDEEASELILVFSDLRQIREVERMRDDFFNNIVHELHTPLATILMYARLLREGKTKGDADKTHRFLGVIERETNRLQKMVRQMLQLARLEARELNRSTESTDLFSLFTQLLPPLADRATEKGLAFSQHIPNSLPAVKGNEDALHLVFGNLIDNSIKFTYTGKVGIEARIDADTIVIEISDDGIGIPQHAIPNLFRRFYRAQTAVERGIAGTGLGLYMVKEGLKTCGGSVEVVSKESVGSTFMVRLPIAGQ
jgi:signal transduction histidine kinase